MSTLTLKINEQFEALISEGAQRARLSKSEWVRRAVLAYSQQPVKKAKFVSAHDLAHEFCGVFKDGPSDLASNPRYMDDFGKV